jgi:Ca2+-binding EF-hand superfamily protein
MKSIVVAVASAALLRAAVGEPECDAQCRVNIFASGDEDGDDLWSTEELVEALNIPVSESANTMAFFDEDKDGHLDFEEFLVIMDTPRPDHYDDVDSQGPEESPEEMMALGDKDGDGKWNEQEFLDMWKEYESYTTEEAENAMKGFDINEDGFIDLQELLRIFENEGPKNAPDISACDLEDFQEFMTEFDLFLAELPETEKKIWKKRNKLEQFTRDTRFMNCKDILARMFTTKTVALELLGVKACDWEKSHEEQMSDPCCNHGMRWDTCCVPSDKTIKVDGLFDTINDQQITQMCGVNADSIREWLVDDIAPTLLGEQHPETGCDARYGATDGNSDDGHDSWARLISPIESCYDNVKYGQTKTSGDNCKTDGDCWLGSCIQDDHQSRCKKAETGNELALGAVRCMLEKIDEKMYESLAKMMGLDPTLKTERTDVEIQAAADIIRDKIGTPSCLGDWTVNDGWCTIGLDETTCKALGPGVIHNHEYAMNWVADSDHDLGGWCKKRSNSFKSLHVGSHTDEPEAGCKSLFAAMGGVCALGHYEQDPPDDEALCEAEGKTWYSFDGLYDTVEYHRLATESVWGDDGVVHYQGSKKMCNLEKTCNWDPDNRFTDGDEDLCVNPVPWKLTKYRPTAFLEEDGKKMTCLRCWDQDRCEEFHASSPGTCIVAPHFNHDDSTSCAEQSGGGPSNLDPVVKIANVDEWQSCQRTDRTAVEECLEPSICPDPSVREWWHDENDPWVHNCGEPGCYHKTMTKEECEDDWDQSDTNLYPNIHRWWREDWKMGAGICRMEWDRSNQDNLRDKSRCESIDSQDADIFWWEGRQYKPPMFASAESCTEYCEDHSWPPKETCPDSGPGSKVCQLGRCPQCLAGHDKFKTGACVLDVSREECERDHTPVYRWDWHSKSCYKAIDEDYSGTEEDCSKLVVADHTHEFFSCVGLEEGACMAYCWNKAITDQHTCRETEGCDWKWEIGRASFNRANFPLDLASVEAPSINA